MDKIKIIIVLGFVFLMIFCVLFLNNNISNLITNYYNSQGLAIDSKNQGYEKRSDGAIRLTDCAPRSCQNPVFSSDGKYIYFTEYKNGYNRGPSEIKRINLDDFSIDKVINSNDYSYSTSGGNNLLNESILYTSNKNESGNIYMLSSIDAYEKALTNNTDLNTKAFYPAFNPTDEKSIVFSKINYGTKSIALLNLDNNIISELTNEKTSDFLNPSWSTDGKSIVYQNSIKSLDNWQIIISDIEYSNQKAKLINYNKIYDDNHTKIKPIWANKDKYIIASSNYSNDYFTHLYAFPIDQSTEPINITNYSSFDSSPTYSSALSSISFESKKSDNDDTPTEIWLIPKLIFE